MTLRRSWRWLGSYCPNSSTGENDLPSQIIVTIPMPIRGEGEEKPPATLQSVGNVRTTLNARLNSRRLRRLGASWRLRRVEFEEITPAVSGRTRKERMLSAGVSLFAFLGATSAQLLAFRVRQNPKALHGGCRRPHERLEKRMRHNT